MAGSIPVDFLSSVKACGDFLGRRTAEGLDTLGTSGYGRVCLASCLGMIFVVGFDVSFRVLEDTIWNIMVHALDYFMFLFGEAEE